jgi:hypothetical protein
MFSVTSIRINALPILTSLFIVAYLIILLANIGWGLPDRNRSSMLVYGKEATRAELNELTRDWQYCASRQTKEAMFYGGMPDAEEKITNFPRECIESPILSLRRFILYGVAQDESRTFQALSRMRPSEFDFDPGRFENGTAFIYPIGAIIYALKKFDQIEVKQNLPFYLQNPKHIQKIYYAGRILCIVASIGTLILLYQIGSRFHSRLAGLLGALCYGSLEPVFFLALQARVHTYATFFVTLGIFFVLVFVQRSLVRYLVFASISLGIAIGTAVTTFVAWLGILIFILISDIDRRKKFWLVFMSGLVVTLTFFVTNPYALINYEEFVLYWVGVVSPTGEGGLGYGPSIVDIYARLETATVKLLNVPLIGMLLLGLLWSIFKSREPWRQLGILTVVSLLFYAIIGFTGRISMFVWPLASILLGILLVHVKEKLDNRRTLFGLILVFGFVPGYTVLAERAYGLLNHETNQTWYAESISCLAELGIKREHGIGLYELPRPKSFPPFPFIGSPLTVLTDNPVEDSEFVVIRDGLDQDKWLLHPQRSLYEYQCSVKGAYGLRGGYLHQSASFYRRSKFIRGG